MDNTLVRISAQYYENYGSVEAPYWKPKGGQEFSLRVDSDLFLYADEECEKALRLLVESKSNDYARYEYLDHDLVFSEPVPLPTEDFMAAFEKVQQVYEDMAHKAAAFLED